MGFIIIMTRSLHLYYFILTLAVVHGFIKSLSVKRTFHCVPQRFKIGSNSLSRSVTMNMVDNSNDDDINRTADASVEGYLSSDINSLKDGKQLRVFLYIFFALVPCLLLIPFIMSRDFTPAIDSDAYKL